jgi:hypothetical protein
VLPPRGAWLNFPSGVRLNSSKSLIKFRSIRSPAAMRNKTGPNTSPVSGSVWSFANSSTAHVCPNDSNCGVGPARLSMMRSKISIAAIAPL